MNNLILCIVFLLIQCIYSTRGQRSSGCDSLFLWQCKSGECIEFGKRCNGVADCTDGSDETVRECISFQCPDNTFRCTYGACVNETRECNGVKDCHDNSDELSDKCIPDNEIRKRGTCTADQFQCKSGECIPIDNLCDGTKECQDSSDETVEFCASKCCPPFGFRCGYGACIDEKVRCDGNIDCVDESDENDLLCGYRDRGRPRPMTTTTTSTTTRSTVISTSTSPTTIRPTRPENNNDSNAIFSENSSPFGLCRITKIPRNGWIESALESSGILEPGEYVNSGAVVNIKCLENHVIEGPTANFCFMGRWRSEFTDCQPRCSSKSINSISTVATNCYLNGVEVRCSESAKPGTTAHVKCRNHYTRQSDSLSELQITSCGDDGIWSPLPETCSQICGEEASENSNPYIFGGSLATISQVPWHVGIYRFNGNKYDLQCGGTIVNNRVIIATMHCFWDSSEAKPYDVSLYRIAVGSEKHDYYAVENRRFEIERISFDPGFNRNTGKYAADVALIILKTAINFKSYTTPVCVPWA